MISLHSHSGQFCLHAKGTLEQVVLKAIEKGFLVYGLSEHIPRSRKQDLYPEESHLQPSDLSNTFRDFLDEAERLKMKYSNQIQLVVGMETEWIRSTNVQEIQELYQDSRISYMVGSVHHVNQIPIDFDLKTYQEALNTVGNDLDALYEAYFDSQLDMLKGLEPTIVGHFDLIRLFSPNHPISPLIWSKIKRNAQFIKEYGGIVEINSRSLKKSLPDPYPQRDILQLLIDLGLSFTLSDDSHGPDDVGMYYNELYQYLNEFNIQSVLYPKDRTTLNRLDVNHETRKIF